MISVEQVREYIGDSGVDDNQARLEDTFTNDAIAAAMRHAANDFNTIPPYTLQVSADSLPADTTIMYDGIAYHLYRRAVDIIRRNDLVYEGGGMKISFTARQIEHFMRIRDEYQQRFRENAAVAKQTASLRYLYGSI